MHATLALPGTTDEERAELAAQKLQRMIEHAELVEAVPEPLRNNFERLRTLHMYGLLCYDLFTVVDEQALLLTEQALRTRFVDLYGRRITFAKAGEEDRQLEAPRFTDVYDAVRSREYRGWRLRLRNGETLARFDASTKSLYHWARSEGLLSGHRNRHYEQITIKMRDRVAHPDAYRLTWEIESARAIHELAELINQLWGVPGRGRYRRTIHREVLAVGWTEQGSLSFGRAIGLPYCRDRDEHTIALVRGYFDDDGISELDTGFELTFLPVEVLKEPGSAADAIAWLENECPGDDDADFHDRLFLIREHNAQVDPPRRAEVAAALDSRQRAGRWLLVEADHPADAWVHARNHFSGDEHCTKKGPCEACSAETVLGGNLEVILDKVAERIDAAVVPEIRPAFRVPGRRWIWGNVARGADESSDD